MNGSLCIPTPVQNEEVFDKKKFSDSHEKSRARIVGLLTVMHNVCGQNEFLFFVQHTSSGGTHSDVVTVDVMLTSPKA